MAFEVVKTRYWKFPKLQEGSPIKVSYLRCLSICSLHTGFLLGYKGQNLVQSHSLWANYRSDLTRDDGTSDGILQQNDQQIQLRLTMTQNDWLSSDHWNLHFFPVQLDRVIRLSHVVPPSCCLEPLQVFDTGGVVMEGTSLPTSLGGGCILILMGG